MPRCCAPPPLNPPKFERGRLGDNVGRMGQIGTEPPLTPQPPSPSGLPPQGEEIGKGFLRGRIERCNVRAE